jgi:hypothetical protein
VWLASIGSVRLGVHLQDGWCLNMRGQTRLLSKSEDMMPLLPLLEIGREQFYAHLYRVAQAVPELKEVSLSFPSILLLIFAFESSASDYWPLKALDWFDNEVSIDSKSHESLQFLLSQPKITQRLKQRVEKSIRYLQAKEKSQTTYHIPSPPTK